MKPLCVDLFCGLGGWAEGFLAEGYDVVGFDIERHVYGDQRYPAQLVLQDVLTLHGSQFRNAAVIVASPPCQAYSYRAMPWKRAKALPPPDNALFDACFRIQREASEAAGRHIPMVVENVKGAQPWVGSARWHYGSFYLWGDVPALMPFANSTRQKFPGNCSPRLWKDREVSGGSILAHAFHQPIKNNGGSWFAQAHNTESGHSQNPVNGLKVPGINLSKVGFNVAAAQRYREGIKQHGSGPEWFDNGIAKHSSRSDSRKAASAMIAKIPFPLAQHIARVYKPVEREAVADPIRLELAG